MKIPFKQIFTLLKKEIPIYKIAKETGIPAPLISKVIAGTWSIPRSQIKEMREAGFKICSCCKRRIVPLRPIDNVQLTRLCWHCYKRGGNSELIYEVSPLNNLINLN